jgi:hypothetical protein
MAEVVLDGFPGQGAATNLWNVDSDGHAVIVKRSAAFGKKGIYRAALTSPAVGAPPAGTVLWVLGPVFPTPPSKLVVVNSVKVACTVASTITTAVQMDLGLYFQRNGGFIPNSGTAFAPTPATQQQMRTSMGGSVSTLAICGNPGNLSGTIDTNPIGVVMGFSGTAVGTQFFSPSMATLYQRDNEDNHPVILPNTGGNTCDKLVIACVNAGPATGSITVTVIVEWEETVAY